jgi:ADP-ribosylglycohydrolase
MKLTWINLPDLIEFELRQRAEEGLDVDAFRQRWETINNRGASSVEREAEQLLNELSALPAPNQLQEREPSELEAIWRARPEVSKLPRKKILEDELSDRVLGGWLGRAAGCLLGKPIEKIPRAGIKELLQSNNTWPLSDYITANGIPPESLKKYPWNKHFGQESLRENIECMTEDDDMNYPMLNLRVLEMHGMNFTTEQIAETWLSLLPALSTFTAERVAYFNLLRGVSPPATAEFRNPYREWIGAQIRADVWGWVLPGQPQRAAELAWRDARLSHVRNGIYGELFFAAAISAAFVYNDPILILNAGLGQIPRQSRLADAVRFAMEVSRMEKDWERIVDCLYEKFGTYHWVHTINNAALATAAVVYGAGDFERSICSVVMGGWDTDSNGATVGAILGTMLGARNLPAKWIAPLNNRIRSGMKGFDNSAIDELAMRTVKQIQTK